MRLSAKDWTPHEYQKKAVKWLVSHQYAGLFADPGLGKTSVVLKAIQVLKKNKVCNRALIVAPLRPSYMVWSLDGELGKWSDFIDLTTTHLHGLKKAQALKAEADLHIINFEGLPWLINQNGLKGYDLLVVDELSKFKNTNTKRYRLIKKLLGQFPRRWGLTGTPASNGLIDLFGQMYVLDRGLSLGPYVTHYRNQYFHPSGYGGYQWKLNEGADKKIYTKIRSVALSLRAKDLLELPRYLERELWVTLPEKAEQKYHDMEKDLFAVMDQGAVEAANAAVASGKCRQIASGGVYREVPPTEIGKPPTRETLHVHDAKTEALKDLVEELQGRPLLVGYEFQHDLVRIQKALPQAKAIVSGQSPKTTAKLIKQWNNGEISILCGHPASIGHGLNLQEGGCHICWYSCTWDLELYDQFVRRVWRQGNKASRVIVYRIVARDTVDQVVIKALSAKRRGQDRLLDALRRYRVQKNSC